MITIFDYKVSILLSLVGIIPPIIWLLFWLREDKEKPEPKGAIFAVLLGGIIAALLSIYFITIIKNCLDNANCNIINIIVLTVEDIIKTNIDVKDIQNIIIPAVEEVVKFLVAVLIIFKTNYIDEPIDWPIYLIAIAVGFAAFENIIFLLDDKIPKYDDTAPFLIITLRFLGANLLHTISSGIIGISMGLSFFMGKIRKTFYIFGGIIFAIIIHYAYNIFILKGNDIAKEDLINHIFTVFGALWVITIFVILLFEKLRRMSGLTKIIYAK